MNGDDYTQKPDDISSVMSPYPDPDQALVDRMRIQQAAQQAFQPTAPTIPQPSPSAPQVAPATAAPNPGGLVQKLTSVADSLGQRRVLPEEQGVNAAQDKAAALYAPTVARGPDGKVLPQYRPSIGQRIVRGLTGGFTGGGVGSIRGLQDPYNSAYYNAENARRQQLKGAGAALQYYQKRFKNALDAAKQQEGTAGVQERAYSSAGTLQNKEELENERERHNQETESLKQQNQDLLEQVKDPALRQQQWDKIFGAPKTQQDRIDRKDYIANGKVGMRTPRAAAVGEIELNQAREAFKAQTGHYPQNLDEQNQVAATAKGMLDKRDYQQKGTTPTLKDKAAVDKLSDAWYASHTKAADSAKTRWLGLHPSLDETDKAYKDEEKKIDDQYQKDAATFEERKKGYYAAVNGKTPQPIQAHPDDSEIDAEKGVNPYQNIPVQAAPAKTGAVKTAKDYLSKIGIK